MSNEILQPFQLNANGGIAMTSDPNVQAQQHIMSLLATAPTERVMIPAYGAGVKSYVFVPDDDIVGFNLRQDVQTAMDTFEPNIIVASIDVISTGDPEDPAEITMDWELGQIQTGASTGVNTATILIGGDVIVNGVQTS